MFDFLKHKQPALAGLRIEDYALIGDCETAALVGLNGSIDWLCWPTFSSPACFAALLGTHENGFWRIAPNEKILKTTRRYLPDTMIVETTFETAHGAVALIDFMPPRGEASDVVRIVRGLRGKVALRMELVLRFDYGKTIPWVTRIDDGLRAIAGAEMVVLRTALKLDNEGMKTCSDFTVKAGDEVPFTMTYGSSLGRDGDKPVADPKPFSAFDAFDETVSFWTAWAAKSTYQGKYRDAVQRSLMTLKALTYRPSGGIVAAATMALPEALGGQRNWDYRFCWLRDTSFTLMVLLMSGYQHEARAWRRWLLRAIAGAPTQLQTIYGICGEKELFERPAGWLAGYERSQPVLIGNAASEQFQLDVFGEVVSALTRMPAAEDDIKVSSGSVQGQVVDHLCKVWDQPDDGIWETRGGRKHFTHSKVMAWVALDRAIKHYEQFDGSGDIKGWRRNPRAAAQADLQEGLQQEAERLHPVLRLDHARCFLPAHRPGRLSAHGRSAHCGHHRCHRQKALARRLHRALRHQSLTRRPAPGRRRLSRLHGLDGGLPVAHRPQGTGGGAV